MLYALAAKYKALKNIPRQFSISRWKEDVGKANSIQNDQFSRAKEYFYTLYATKDIFVYIYFCTIFTYVFMFKMRKTMTLRLSHIIDLGLRRKDLYPFDE